MNAQCLIVNCNRKAPDDEAFCAKHRGDNATDGMSDLKADNVRLRKAGDELAALAERAREEMWHQREKADDHLRVGVLAWKASTVDEDMSSTSNVHKGTGSNVPRGEGVNLSGSLPTAMRIET